MTRRNPTKSLRKLVADKRGASMVEYSLLLFLVLVVAAVVYKQVGKNVRMAGDKTAAAFL